jgi:hypothetical protein
VDVTEVTVTWDNTALKAWAETGAGPQAALDLFAGRVTNEMKRLCPVSPVMPVYAYPVPAGRSRGPAYKGRGLALPGGADVSRTRYPGDLPLHPSGYLRSSIHAFRQGDGSIIIGPTADYGEYVNDGTPPHEISSTGPWPLRNRASGQVFGRHVHHPGTRPVHFVERSLGILAGETVHVDG